MPSSTRVSTRTTSPPELLPGGDRAESLRYAARIEAGLRDFLDDAGAGVHDELRGSRRAAPAARPRRAAADGDGFGFGGEGDWKTSALVHTLKAMSADRARWDVVHGGLHVPPRPGRTEGARRPHARGLPDDHDGRAERRDPSAEHRRPRGPGAPRVHRRSRSRHRRRPRRPRRPLPARPQQHRSRARPTSRCRSFPSPTPCGSPVPISRRRWSHGCAPGAAPHLPVDGGRPRGDGRPRRNPAHRAGRDRRAHHDSRPSPTSCAGTRPTTAWPRGCRAATPRAGRGAS